MVAPESCKHKHYTHEEFTRIFRDPESEVIDKDEAYFVRIPDCVGFDNSLSPRELMFLENLHRIRRSYGKNGVPFNMRSFAEICGAGYRQTKVVIASLEKKGFIGRKRKGPITYIYFRSFTNIYQGSIGDTVSVSELGIYSKSKKRKKPKNKGCDLCKSREKSQSGSTISGAKFPLKTKGSPPPRGGDYCPVAERSSPQPEAIRVPTPGDYCPEQTEGKYPNKSSPEPCDKPVTGVRTEICDAPAFKRLKREKRKEEEEIAEQLRCPAGASLRDLPSSDSLRSPSGFCTSDENPKHEGNVHTCDDEKINVIVCDDEIGNASALLAAPPRASYVTSPEKSVDSEPAVAEADVASEPSPVSATFDPTVIPERKLAVSPVMRFATDDPDEGEQIVMFDTGPDSKAEKSKARPDVRRERAVTKKSPPKPGARGDKKKKARKRARKTPKGGTTPGEIVGMFNKRLREDYPDAAVPLVTTGKDIGNLSKSVSIYTPDVVAKMIGVLFSDWAVFKNFVWPNLREDHPVISHLWRYAETLSSRIKTGVKVGRASVSSYAVRETNAADVYAVPDMNAAYKKKFGDNK